MGLINIKFGNKSVWFNTLSKDYNYPLNLTERSCLDKFLIHLSKEISEEEAYEVFKYLTAIHIKDENSNFWCNITVDDKERIMEKAIADNIWRNYIVL